MEAAPKNPLILLLILLSATVPPTSMISAKELCNTHDKKVLFQIKEGFGSVFPSWNSDTDCCTDWYGVQCNSNNRVNNIDISYDSDIKSTIPSVIADLPYLEILELHKLPNLVGTIPESITKLKYLSYLWITWTNVTGFPDFISKIPTLTYINLSFNNLTGTIPPSLSVLDNVNYVDLSRNKLTGPIPESFGSFKQASNFYLILSHNELSGSIPESLTKLTLQNFNVSYNKLCGQIPQGGNLQSYDQYEYFHNKCLCGSPLPACK
ncbi:Polygalacturonase inhibitor-like protein [Drosera capensis]